MVDIPSGSGANKGFWEVQLRDKYGKFVEMGGAVMFEIQLEGVQGKSTGVGYFIGNLDLETARIEVRDNKKIPKGVYLVNRKDITAIQAILPEESVEEESAEAEAPAEPELRLRMSGTEALNLRLKSMGNILREDGRFPAPRMSYLDREDSDNRRAAKRDYKKVFNAEPALQEKYKTFENMWQQVYKYGTDERTQSPNVLADIPEDMKELNRAYAKHFLGLDPEGLITVYRNAVNGKDTEQESAVGYASTDALMAYDYASHRDNVAANGRYEIDVKPSEVYGMLGYSRIEDEYGITIGRELANIPGRVRRVGDLAMVLPEAPWLREWGLRFNRGKGASPFRQYSLATSHEFHPVESFGDSMEEFFTKYNISAADIKNKFDEIYGEGAYEKYKATGNTVKFNKLRDLFVELPDGRIGLDLGKLDRLDSLSEVSEYTGDIFDNTMKMLSVFQELTGQYFMTHRTREYTPPVQEKTESEKPESQVLGVTTWVSPPTEAQKQALEDYASGELADTGNTYLRTGDLPAPYAREDGEPESMAKFKAELRAEAEEKIKNLSSAFEGAALNTDITLYRSLEDPSFGFDYNLELKDGEVLDLSRLEGTIYTDKGFMSTTKDADFSYSSSSIRLTINAKAGQKAIDLLGAIRFDSLQREQEVIFPAGSKFKISKASYNSDEGKYYIEMDYLDESESDSAVEEAPEDASTMYDEFFDGGMVDLRALRNSGDRVSPYDLEMFSEDQLAALGEYGQAGHRWVNKVLRGGDPISDKEQKIIDGLDAAIEENGEVFSAARIFRGDTPSQSSDYYKFLEGLTEGKVINFPGYFSTSNDAQIAFSEFGPGQGGSDDDASNSHLGSTFFWSIDIPEGGKAMAMPEGLGYRQGAESEVILPRNTNLKIIGIKKVEQLDDEGNPTGNYNYFIHAEQQPSAPKVVSISGLESLKDLDLSGYEKPQESLVEYQPTKQEYDEFFAVEIDSESMDTLDFINLGSYQSDDSNRLNNSIRASYENGEELDDPKIERLDSTISKSRFTEETVLYRGISVPADVYEAYLEKKVGDVEVNLGYTSTTHSKNVADGFARSISGNSKVIYKITAPAGTPAVRVTDHTADMELELEFLLPRNLSLKIVGISKDENDALVFDMTVVVD